MVFFSSDWSRLRRAMGLARSRLHAHWHNCSRAHARCRFLARTKQTRSRCLHSSQLGKRSSRLRSRVQLASWCHRYSQYAIWLLLYYALQIQYVCNWSLATHLGPHRSANRQIRDGNSKGSQWDGHSQSLEILPLLWILKFRVNQFRRNVNRDWDTSFCYLKLFFEYGGYDRTNLLFKSKSLWD